ncbi:unnamed protein product [Adineta ricciae]|uniref:NAD(P)(+)--arginine ADP-ribosyltransferase n=1 Tax=Adineta ricciae TaxID=249248 RepID=A0A814JEA6_ADIRI|nr:unnamed protein product [Adineta ricciae]CAF1035671.1 unnamed protein product [Adineta ricciae]
MVNCIMAEATDISKTVEWMWQLKPNSSSTDEPTTWNHYSDVENLIIEEAFSNKQQRAILDSCFIDFDNEIQVSNSDNQDQRPVKRVVGNRKDKHVREARFMDLPVPSTGFFGGQYGFVSPFIIEVRKDLDLEDYQLPSRKPQTIPMLVEKAAHGIIAEGERIGKQREAEKLVNLLSEKKNSGRVEVWKRCAYLYSLESFLYKTLNAAMRLVGSQEDEEIWRSKIPTLGPFSLLLWDDPCNKRMKANIELYRGANLESEQIEIYKGMAARNDKYGSFQGFSSCTRNRAKAEAFGNTLFIIQVKYAFIADLSDLSEYPEEEEELIMPGVCFRVVRVDFDYKKNQHLIYVELQQSWSIKDKKHLETKLALEASSGEFCGMFNDIHRPIYRLLADDDQRQAHLDFDDFAYDDYDAGLHLKLDDRDYDRYGKHLSQQ